MGFLDWLFKLKVPPIDIGVPPNTVVMPDDFHADPSESSQPLGPDQTPDDFA